MNALMTLASMVSASTQTVLSDVNVPWDTVWTSVESDVKVSLSSSSSISLFLSYFVTIYPPGASFQKGLKYEILPGLSVG